MCSGSLFNFTLGIRDASVRNRRSARTFIPRTGFIIKTFWFGKIGHLEKKLQCFQGVTQGSKWAISTKPANPGEQRPRIVVKAGHRGVLKKFEKSAEIASGSPKSDWPLRGGVFQKKISLVVCLSPLKVGVTFNKLFQGWKMPNFAT